MSYGSRRNSQTLGRRASRMGQQLKGFVDTYQYKENKNFKVFLGAKVFWPPDCSDDVLESAVLEAHSLVKQQQAGDQAVEGASGAESLKKYMDKCHGPTWHVVYGTSFGCFTTHEKRQFIFFYIDKIAFLMFKIG